MAGMGTAIKALQKYLTQGQPPPLTHDEPTRRFSLWPLGISGNKCCGFHFLCLHIFQAKDAP
jgi:hypothetical protein